MADLNIGNSSASVVVNAKHNGSVIPQINNTYDLGTSDLRWKNIYGGTFIGSLNGNATTATKATQDSAGQQINTTYIKGLSASGKTITYTKGDGTTGTITTQDSDTTYSAGTGLSLSGTKFSIDSTVVTKDSTLQTTNPFKGSTLYISKIDNAFYSAQKRWTVTGSYTGSSNGTYSTSQLAVLFDGDYESTLIVPKGCIAKIRITFDTNNETNTYSGVKVFPGYPYGYAYISYYYISTPSVPSKMRMYCNYGPQVIGEHEYTMSAFAGSYSSQGASNGNSSVVEYVRQPNYAMSYIEFEINGATNYDVAVSQIEMKLDRPSSTKTPFLSKYGAETLYYPLTAPQFNGNASTATKLQTARTISLIGSVTGSGTFDGSGNLSITTTTNHTHAVATTSANGFMSSGDKAKLDGITASADAVSFSRSLTSGTKVGTITINGTGTDLYAPTNTDTHWTTGITAGETGTTSNSATTNGNTFIKIKDNSTHRGQIKLVGSGATSVSSDANGIITISSTDNNTTYGSMSVDEGTTGTATTNRVLTAANLKGIINAHAPTKTGSGASGTWGISISGNAASASKVNNKLTVGSKSYDGSAAVTIAASDLGLASAMLFLGTTTTAITDGATTNPVVLGGSNKTVTAGNVVLYGSKEFVWTGSAWEELGNEGSYKIVQAAVADPSASGTSNTFIATISQDANGKITATKKTVAVTNSAPTLAWGTTSTIGTVAGTNLQVKMPANPNTDTKVTQTAINAADYTNWRPLIWGASNNGTEGFTPSTVTDGVFTAQTLSCQPSSGIIRATTFKGNLSGNAATATKLQTARTISLAGSVTGSGTFDGSGNLSISTTTNHSHNYLSYKSILDSESAINSFHAANAFQAATWSGTSSPGVSNGIILDMGYTSTTYGAQIAIDDDPTYFMALRQRGSNGWNAWKRIPMGDGTGASGTWGISVTGSSASCNGNAATATKLATARTIRTNLASTSAASFDGSANITPGVSGTLPISHGGTGATNASAARNNLGAQSKVLYGPSAPSDSTGSNGDMYIALESGDFKKDIVNLIYPVGSIYISMNSTNPSTLFGGTWQAFGQGRTLIGVGTGNDGTTRMSFTSGGKTGGTYKNTHNHYTLYSNDGAAFFMSMSSNAPRSRVVTKDRANWTLSNTSAVTREDSTYNETIDIVQPYITVYFWRRTA